MVYEASLELILAFNWPSEASWKADVIKYDFREGPRSFDPPPPQRNFRFLAPVGGTREGQQASHASSLRLKPTGRRMTGSDPRWTLRLLGGFKGGNSIYPFGVPQLVRVVGFGLRVVDFPEC